MNTAHLRACKPELLRRNQVVSCASKTWMMSELICGNLLTRRPLVYMNIASS